MKTLTPFDCDIRDFPFLPLDVVRLRDSDIVSLSSGDEFRCAVLLWCASWHQIPAASLPNDDVVLSNLAGFGRVVKEWKKVREGALRGWILCDDGRFYHPVVAEKALTAWESKLERMWKTECARIKKHNQRHEDNQLKFPEFEEWLSLRELNNVPEDNIKNNTPKTEPVPKDTPPLSPEKTLQRDRERERERESKQYKTTVVDDLTVPSVEQTPPQQQSAKILNLNQNSNQPFTMHAEWTPSESFEGLAKIAGFVFTDRLPVAELGEFKTYWLTHEHQAITQGQWEHKFIQNLISHKVRKGAGQ